MNNYLSAVGNSFLNLFGGKKKVEFIYILLVDRLSNRLVVLMDC